MHLYNRIMNTSKLLTNQPPNIIKYSVLVSITIIVANLLLQRCLNYSLLSYIRPTWFNSTTPSTNVLFTSFEFDPIERFNLDNLKYGWIITALAIVLLALIIGC